MTIKTNNVCSIFSWTISLWIIARVGLSIWGGVIAASDLIPQGAGERFYHGIPLEDREVAGSILGVWQRWDAIHYQRIAQSGYSSNELSAFFPLYPLLAGFAYKLFGGNSLFWLIAISNIALLISSLLIYQITNDLFSEVVARRTLVVMLSFPLSFFYFAPYPQSLALTLILLSFVFLKHNRLFLSAVAGILSGLTHPTVLPMILAMSWDSWDNWRIRAVTDKLFSLFIPISPALGAGLFLLWRHAYGFTPYQTLLRNHWGHYAQLPWKTIMDLKNIFQSQFFLISGWVNLLVFVVVLLISIWEFNRIPKMFSIFQISLIVMLLSVTMELEPLGSTARYSLLMFPVFIGLGLWTDTKWKKLSVFVAAVSLQLFLAGMFFLWVWVG